MNISYFDVTLFLQQNNNRLPAESAIVPSVTLTRKALGKALAPFGIYIFLNLTLRWHRKCPKADLGSNPSLPTPISGHEG